MFRRWPSRTRCGQARLDVPDRRIGISQRVRLTDGSKRDAAPRTDMGCVASALWPVLRPLFGAAARYVRPPLFMGRIIMNAGWHASRWASWSSKSVAGSAKLAAVGSTPMPSRYVASRPIENEALAAYVRGSLKGCIRNCSVSNPFRIARSADCAQTGLRCVFTIRRAGSSARHFGGQGPMRDSALPRDRPYAGKGRRSLPARIKRIRGYGFLAHSHGAGSA